MELFIQKVAVLTRTFQKSADDKDDLPELFNRLLGVKGKVRLQKPFYVLWFLLLGVDKLIIDEKAALIAKEVMFFFDNNQSLQRDETLTVKDIFKNNVDAFWTKINTH